MITRFHLRTYGQADTVIEQNPGKLFIIEMDNGLVLASRAEARLEFDALAPGESFTIHATCDWEFEAEAERDRIMAGESS